MATIFKFDDFRKKEKQQVLETAGIKPGPHFFCTRCETDRFKLFSAGTVHCAHCGALMRNITVHGQE